MYIHPTLAVTPERLALGLLDWHTFVREPGSLGQDKDSRRPLEEKESVRWVDGYARVNALAEELSDTRLTYVADREGDIYDLFVEAPIPEHSADWLVRVQHRDRCLADGRKLNEALDAAAVLTEITFERPATKGAKARQVTQEIKVVRVTLKAPWRPDRTLPDVTVTALLATEVNPPAGEEPLNWLLLTNLPVETAEEAIETLSWYLCRWQVEIYQSCCLRRNIRWVGRRMRRQGIGALSPTRVGFGAARAGARVRRRRPTPAIGACRRVGLGAPEASLFLAS